MKVRQIIQIEYSQEEYELYIHDREYLLDQGYIINDYSQQGFVLCDWVMEEHEIDKNREEQRTTLSSEERERTD